MIAVLGYRPSEALRRDERGGLPSALMAFSHQPLTISGWDNLDPQHRPSGAAVDAPDPIH